MKLDHVHQTTLNIKGTIELTPPHTQRTESAAYRASHEYLITKMHTPCYVCGVSDLTLSDPHINIYGATQMETHHYPIEYSLEDACSVDRVHKRFPQVINKETLHAFIDSPANLLVLCDQCHRNPLRGVHSSLAQDFAVAPFLEPGYVLVSDKAGAASAQEHDEEVLKSEPPGD